MAKYDVVWVCVFIVGCFAFGQGIVEPGQTTDQKPAYTSGIKTTSWVSPSRVQMHHNYSRVTHQNSLTDGGGVTKTWTHTWTTNQQGSGGNNQHGSGGNNQQSWTSNQQGLGGTNHQSWTTNQQGSSGINQQTNSVYTTHQTTSGGYQPNALSQQVNSVYSHQQGSNGANQQIHPVYNGHSYGALPKDTVVEHKVLVSNRTSGGHHGAIYKVKKEIKHPLEVYSKCPKMVSGQFIYKSSCNQFLNCWKGRGFVQTCPPGTLFNPKTLECDFAEKVECVTGPAEVVDFRPQRNVKQASCPPGFVGLIPDYADCTKFINCNGGFATKTDCPPGTLFDMTKNVCDHPYAATCFNGQNLENSVAGSTTHGGQSGQYTTTGQWQSGGYGGSGQGGQGGQGAHGHFASLDQLSQQQTTRDFNGGWGQHFHDKPSGSSYQQTHTHSSNYQSGHPTGQTGATQTGQGSTSWQQGTHSNTGSYGINQATYQGVSQTAQGGSHGGGQTTYTQTQSNTNQANQGGTYGGQGTYQGGSGTSQGQYTGAQGQNAYTQTQSNTNRVNQGSAYGGQGSYTHQQGTYVQGGSGQTTGGQQGTYRWQVVRNTTTQGGGNSPNYVHVQSGYDSGQYGGGVSTGQQNSGGVIGYGRAEGNQQGGGYNTGPHGTVTHTVTHSQSGHPKCPDGESGIYPHPYDCSKFLNCDHGRTFVQDCGPGTVFNPKIKVCDFPYNVDCQNTVYEGEDQEGHESATEVTYIHTGGGQWGSGGTVHQGSTTGGQQSGGNYGGGSSSGQWVSGGNVHQGSTTGGQESGGNYGGSGQGVHLVYGETSNTPSIPLVHGSGSTTSQGSSGAYQGGNYEQGGSQTTQWSSQGGVSQGQHGGTSQTTQWTQQGFNRHPTQQGGSQGSQGGHSGSYGTTTTVQEGSGQGRWPQRHGGSSSQGQGSWSQGTTNYDQQTTSELDQNQETQHWPKQVNENAPDSAEAVTRSPGDHFITRRPDTGRYTNGNQVGTNQWSQTVTTDYEDTFGTSRHKQFEEEVDNGVEGEWPPPYPSTDLNADYVFEYEDGVEVTLEPENEKEDFEKGSNGCWREDYHCSSDHCIMKTKVCNGVKDCADGSDETRCNEFVAKFNYYQNARLTILEKERWDNVSASTCALLCLETPKFECKAFNYRKIDKTCFLTDQNIGMSGALMSYYPNDYYELKSASVDCSGKFRCGNRKCIDWEQVCDGYDDCGDRMDEKNCSAEAFGYSIKLAGSDRAHEGRVEVSAFGKTGYVCDDSFGINSANVVCKELGFQLGAADVKKNSFYEGDFEYQDIMFMMDDVFCTGNETSLRDCDFSGWGVHNCRQEEVVGVVCKTPFEKCPQNFWQCKTGNECIPLPFVCDGLYDCYDESDEAADICESGMEIRLVDGRSSSEGRLEVKHHGVWGTVCDDDFNEDAAKVICRSLGYTGSSMVKKDGQFGPGEGPIWLDQVSCAGNETSLERCSHWDWGEHNCEHAEDVGVQCSHVDAPPVIPKHDPGRNPYETYNISVYPEQCGLRKDAMFFGQGDGDVHARVIQGTIAEVGDYPWQASIKLRGSGDTASHWCGAIIIGERYVLTAAHCLEGYPKGAYVVVAGDYDTTKSEGTEQRAHIDDYALHKGFRVGHKMNNDIAVVQLKAPGLRLGEDVQAVCLAPKDAEYTADMNCTISGFGTVRSGSAAYSQNLRAAWIPIIPQDICSMPHVYGPHLTENMFCAGSLEGGVDACDGDSGGPLACLHNGHFTLYGIISWGQHCGYANRPGVYVKVSKYRDWIDDQLKKLSQQ